MPEKSIRPKPAPANGDHTDPERLPSGGSGAGERLREAEHEEGRAPARKGAEKDRDEDGPGDP